MEQSWAWALESEGQVTDVYGLSSPNQGFLNSREHGITSGVSDSENPKCGSEMCILSQHSGDRAAGRQNFEGLF